MNIYQLIVALSAGVVPVGLAQAQSKSLAGSRTDDAVVLTPFTVQAERDTGYIASDSLMGGRVSTNLLKTPTDVSVLTRDFLNDVAANSYQDAAIWLPNTVVTPPGTSDFGNTATFRGLGAVGAGFQARNYFRYTQGVDGYIVERLESSRGPNALLFGEGIVSGIINNSTKRARYNWNSAEVLTRVDSEGSRRVQLDVNRPLTDDLAARANLLISEGRNWYEDAYDNRRGGQLTASWRTKFGGELRVEGEYMQWERLAAPSSFTDNASNWTRLNTYSAPSTTTLPGTSRYTTDRLVFGEDYQTIGIQNYLNWGQTSGSGSAIPPNGRNYVARYPSVPKGTNLQPKDADTGVNYHVLSAFFTQNIGDSLSFEIAAMHARTPREIIATRWTQYIIDINTNLPNGLPNPNVGKPYAEAELQDQFWLNTHSDVRLAGVYLLPFKQFTQRVNVITGYRRETFDDELFRWARSNGANPNMTNTANYIYLRRYHEDGTAGSINIPRSSNGIEVDKVLSTDRFEKQRDRYVQVAAIGSYWKDRINVVAGSRWDKFERSQTNVGTRLANGQPNPEGYTREGLEVNVRTVTVGTVFFPIPQVGVYANYSESFNPPGVGGPLLDGALVPAAQGVGKSTGLRLNLLSGRLVGSIGYYDTREEDRTVPTNTDTINALWLNSSTVQQSYLDRQFSFRDVRDTQTVGGTGYELDFVANLTKNLRLRFNYAQPETKQFETAPQFRAYFDQNIALWQAQADNLDNPNRVTVQNNINAYRVFLDGLLENRKQNGRVNYTASWFVNYTMPSGVLKNVRIGGGATYTGRRIVGNVNGQPFNYIYGNAVENYTALVGYSFKWNNIRWDAQVNVSNVLDYDEPIYTGVNTIANVNYKGGFFYLEPRKTTLTLSMKF